MAWSPGCWTNSLTMAGGTARRRTVRSDRPSRRRSTSSKDCWRMSAQPVARPNRSRPDDGVKNTSWSEDCSGGRVPVRSSTQHGGNSRFRPAGIMTCCAPSNIFRAAGGPPDSRIDEAIQLLRSKQQADGTWLLENTHPGKVHFPLEDGDNRPSRWNTLRALRVLGWHEKSAAALSGCLPQPAHVGNSEVIRRVGCSSSHPCRAEDRRA
jgi:hypothetical protein